VSVWLTVVRLQQSGDVVCNAKRHQHDRHNAAKDRQNFQHDRHEILQETHALTSAPINPRSLPIFVHAAYARGSVLLRHVDDRPHRLSTGMG